MITDKQRRNQIIRRIQKISPDKIKKLQDFIDKLEENTPSKKKVLSYAGAWSNIDEDLFKDLTENLISKRQKNKRRFED
jgi:ABC-type phosphate/phosphonate transport system substrate-binding protein